MSFNCLPIKVEIFGCPSSSNVENIFENLEQNKNANNKEKLNSVEPEFVNIKVEPYYDETAEQKAYLTKFEDAVKNEPYVGFHISVKHEPVDDDITQEPHEIPEKENDNFILPDAHPLKPPNDICDHVTAKTGNKSKIAYTIIVVDIQRGSHTSVTNNPAKTGAERMRKYRYRMRKKRALARNNIIDHQDTVEDIERPEFFEHANVKAKTPAERMREYRARKRRKMKASNVVSSDNKNENIVESTDISCHPRIPKTVTERVREHRARKKGDKITKQPKSAKERMQEYRARKKNKTQSIVDIYSTKYLENNIMIHSEEDNAT